MDRRDAEPGEVIVDDAEVITIKITPHDRDEGSGDDHRQKIGKPEQVKQERGHRAIESERKQESDNDVSCHSKDGKTERVPEDLQRAVTGEKALEILQSHPTRAGHRVV